MAKSEMVHDYSKPAKVSNLLYRVYHLLGSDSSCDIADAREVIVSVRILLDDYLASDNLIPDEDSQISNSVSSFAGEASDDLPF